MKGILCRSCHVEGKLVEGPLLGHIELVHPELWRHIELMNRLNRTALKLESGGLT